MSFQGTIEFYGYGADLLPVLLPCVDHPIISEITLTNRYPRWQMPKPWSPMFEYTEADAEWARPLGFGHEIMVEETLTGKGYVERITPDGRYVFRLIQQSGNPSHWTYSGAACLVG